jgi:hypothetical protein
LSIERVYPEMIPEIHRELLTLLDPNRTESEWRQILDPGWDRKEDYVGYLLRSGGKPVAFVGLLFGSMALAGSRERLCNITSWIAKPDHAAESVALLMPLRGLKDYTLTNMSGAHHVRAIFNRLGFRTLEDGTTIMRPPLSPDAFRTPPGVRIASDARDVRVLLGNRDAPIFVDHAPFANHIAMETPPLPHPQAQRVSHRPVSLHQRHPELRQRASCSSLAPAAPARRDNPRVRFPVRRRLLDPRKLHDPPRIPSLVPFVRIGGPRRA